MAKRYENRYGRGSPRRERDYADDRGYMDRATDEVRSWFGDDEAERRRSMDEQRDRQQYYPDRGRSDWNRSDWNRGDWNREGRERRDWGRGGWARSDSDRDDWRGQQYRTGPENWRGGSRESTSGYEDRSRSWALSDWDRDRMSARDRDWSDRGGERDRGWLDRDRDWRSPTYERGTSARYGGSTWSADEGRMQFGGPTPGVGAAGRYESRYESTSRLGRGPKGYQRSDPRIHEDVCERISHADVDASEVEVAVNNGEVTLSGTVRDRWQKHRIEDVAEEVSGVRDVHNNIRVAREDRGIGQSESSASNQPGTVLGVNPTAEANITEPTSTRRRS